MLIFQDIKEFEIFCTLCTYTHTHTHTHTHTRARARARTFLFKNDTTKKIKFPRKEEKLFFNLTEYY